MTPHRRTVSGEDGSTSVFAVIVASVLILLAGLCIEGGRVLDARATLADTAEQAARAGAQQIAMGELRSSGSVALDPATAAGAARDYLAAAGPTDAASSVSVQGGQVLVTLDADIPTTMLRLVGIDSVHLTISGTARTAIGIEDEGR